MALRGLKGGGYVTYKAMEQAGLTDADVAGKTKDEVDATLKGNGAATNLPADIVAKKDQIDTRMAEIAKDSPEYAADIAAVRTLLAKGDVESAFDTFHNSPASYDYINTHDTFSKLRRDAYLHRTVGLDWGTTPGTFTAWHSGGTANAEKNGIFFSPDKGGAEPYSKGGVPPKQYTVTVKNPYVTTRVEDAYAELSGTPIAKVLDAKHKAKSVQAHWLSLDKKVAKLAQKKGHDAITYTDPAPPAPRELVLLSAKGIR